MSQAAGAVLNTRPREQAAELSRLLASAGFDVLEAPAIETITAWDAAELAQVRAHLAGGAYAWVVLPSQNAARALLDELADARVVCGTATALGLGLRPTLPLPRFSASAALEALRPLVGPGQTILVPRAAESREELADGLLALGAGVHAPIAYRTLAVEATLLRARLGHTPVSAVTACSPSALHALLAALNAAWISSRKLICLGDTTAQAAREVGLRVDGVAEQPNMAALVNAVVSALASPGVAA